MYPMFTWACINQRQVKGRLYATFLLWWEGFLSGWPVLFQSVGSRALRLVVTAVQGVRCGSQAVEHRFNSSGMGLVALQYRDLRDGDKPCLLHWQVESAAPALSLGKRDYVIQHFFPSYRILWGCFCKWCWEIVSALYLCLPIYIYRYCVKSKVSYKIIPNLNFFFKNSSQFE